MKELIEKATRGEKIDDEETIAKRVKDELKAAKVRRVSRATDELYIDAGIDEASVFFDPKTNKASVRMVIVREADADGKAIAALLKKHGVPY